MFQWSSKTYYFRNLDRGSSLDKNQENRGFGWQCRDYGPWCFQSL